MRSLVGSPAEHHHRQIRYAPRPALGRKPRLDSGGRTHPSTGTRHLRNVPRQPVPVRQTSLVRIGTWNLQGRWDERHRMHVGSMRCDVLLLTEVSARVVIPGMNLHGTRGLMAQCRRWAAVASRDQVIPLDDPHGATAMVEVNGLRICSSILPWRSCGTRDPWRGTSTAERTAAAVTDLEVAKPVVWGGDWNHALSGREWTGSQGGRRTILETVDRLGLKIPTASAPHQIEGLLSIDHIAIPVAWAVVGVERHSAFTSGARISDHDAYVIEVS